MRLRNRNITDEAAEDTADKMAPKTRAPATPKGSKRAVVKSTSKKDDEAQPSAAASQNEVEIIGEIKLTQSTQNLALGDPADSEDDDDADNDVHLEADDDQDDDFHSEGIDDDATQLDRSHQATGTRDAHQIPAYPTELRVTRTYYGLMKKWDRGRALIERFYGTDEPTLQIIYDLRDVWIQRPIVPGHGGAENGGVMESPWFSKTDVPKLEQGMTRWWTNYQKNVPADKQQKTTVVIEERKFNTLPRDLVDKILPSGGGDILVLMGLKDRSRWHLLKQGDSKSMHWNGEPTVAAKESADYDGAPAAGWLSYYGGIPLSAEWAPLTGKVPQILALAIIPPEDQVMRPDEEKPAEEDLKHGCIHFIKHEFQEVSGMVYPSESTPILQLALLFDWGRPKRLKWCPVPTTDPAVTGLVAVLTSDHKVRVLEVKLRKEPAIETVDQPIATMGLDEYKVHTTTFTWIATNRLALGHSDGTVTIWSIYPNVILSRHPVCMTTIVDMASAFPSHPYTITATATSGATRIIDLAAPSQEHSFTNSPTVCFQTSLSNWSDHMQGFIIQNPSSSPGNTSLAFGHVRAFPVPRTVMTGPANLICASIGAKHPFALAGFADGSVWSCNALRKVLYSLNERLYKLELFRHQYMPFETLDPQWKVRVLEMPEAKGQNIRATATFWAGFTPEINKSQANDAINDREPDKSAQGSGKGRQGGKSKEQKNKDRKNQEKEKERRRYHDRMGEGDLGDPLEIDEQEDEVEQEQEEEDNAQYAPYKFVAHEPLSRVTAVAWNPNIEFAWWAAVAMGSGLVRVMDLGLRDEQKPNKGKEVVVEEAGEEVADAVD